MKKILIIDDSVTLRESLEYILTNEGYKVDKAENGLIALKKFNDNKDYSLIFVDINMPEMDGLEFIKEVRKIDKITPIVVLTTVSEKDKIEQAKNYKANAWMIKPFIEEDLLVVVKKLIK